MIYLESLKYSLKKNRIRKRSVQFGGVGGGAQVDRCMVIVLKDR